MVVRIPGRLSVLQGNVRFLDRTREGVAVHMTRGVERQEGLKPSFVRHVARQPWYELTGPEREAISGPREDVSPSTLFAFDFPMSIVDAFWDRFVNRLLDSTEDEARREVLDEYRGFVLESLADSDSIEVAAIRSFDLAFSPPGAFSTAFDPRSGKYVGLHLDDHDRLPFDERWRGFQLMSLNLGRAERYFQFINHDVASLIRQLDGVSALPEAGRSASTLVQSVFRSVPDCPVFRLTLKPGQGSISVPQDMIHDGATNRRGRPDIDCLIGGRFLSVEREP